MDIISDYRISSHWASDDANLDLVAERVRRAYEQLARARGRTPTAVGRTASASFAAPATREPRARRRHRVAR